MSNFGAQDPLVLHAIREIEDTFGDVVSVEDKKKSLLKYGLIKSTDGTAEQTIANFQGSTLLETYATTNSVDSFITDDTGTNTSTIFIEGHTIANGLLTFVTQSKALNSQNRVALDTPLARVNRMYTETGTGNTPAKLVYAYDSTVAASPSGGVPNEAAATKCTMDFIEFQSEKCATSISATDYWIVTGFYAAIFKKNAASAKVRLRYGAVGENQRTRAPILFLDSDGTAADSEEFKPYLIIPKNNDVVLTVEGSASAIEVVGGINGYLASVVT